MAFALLSILALSIMSVVAAENVKVGGDSGWGFNVDYKLWAQAQNNAVHVNDTLVFEYKKGAHNVLAVDKVAFDNCDATNPKKTLESGDDRIVVNSTGTRWYICGFPNHCSKGMKVAIHVLPSSSTSSPSPSPSALPPTPGSSSNLLPSLAFALFSIMAASLLLI